MNTDQLIQDSLKRFDEKWERIEKTMTGDISGRKIWDADTQGHDDEANYLFIDETLKQFMFKELKTIVQKTREETAREIFRNLGNVVHRAGGSEECTVNNSTLVAIENKYLKEPKP